MSDDARVEKKGGCLKFAAIGCLGLLIVGGVAGYFVYQKAAGFVSEIVGEYTAEEPLKLPRVESSQEEIKAVIDQVTLFNQALEGGQKTPALVMTSHDVNVLIQHHPSFSDYSDKIHVKIEGSDIRGQVSLPLEKFFPMFTGKYLNGTATFKVSLASGRLFVFIDSLEVAGKPLSEEFMTGFRSQNLTDEFNKNPENKKAFENLESIKVQDGKIYLEPKVQ